MSTGIASRQRRWIGATEATVDRPGESSILDSVSSEIIDPKRDPYVAVADLAIRTFVTSGRVPSLPEGLPAGMNERAAVFVSIKKAGELRGCIGTITPTEQTVAHEIVANAIKSATADPRFPPVQEEELDALSISVDVLSPPEPCQESDLDPLRYGVIVGSGWRRGLLLPDLPGVRTTDEQIRIARRKAAIAADEPTSLQRFTVKRHG
jgi:AmmeMemoRadiSam system protein A